LQHRQSVKLAITSATRTATFSGAVVVNALQNTHDVGVFGYESGARRSLTDNGRGAYIGRSGRVPLVIERTVLSNELV
jgi:hypothetical protein